MTAHAFTLTVAALCAATACVIFGAARGLGVEAPGDEVTLIEPVDSAENLIAVAEGACEGHGRTWVPVGEGHDCWPVERLRAGPMVKRRAR